MKLFDPYEAFILFLTLWLGAVVGGYASLKWLAMHDEWIAHALAFTLFVIVIFVLSFALWCVVWGGPEAGKKE